MKLEEFTKELYKTADKDYGICPPPLDANKAMSILINHLLGKDWYVTMPMSREQVYSEAVADILGRYSDISERISIKNIIKNIFKLKKRLSKNTNIINTNIENTMLDNTDISMLLSALRDQLNSLKRMKEKCTNYKYKNDINERMINIQALIFKLEKDNRRINNEYSKN
jgi:hypothetical protein